MTGSRRNNLYETRVDDPYVARGKHAEPTVCPDCDAVYQKGRWTWADKPRDASHHRCPACSRIHDDMPAGILTLGGDFYQQHEDEIMNLVRNTEAMEMQQHPLERIMKVERMNGDCVLSFTGIHLTKTTGSALQSAYNGHFDFSYSDREHTMRASWAR